MLSRANTKVAQDFRVMLVTGGAVTAEEIVKTSTEAEAFARAEETAARAVTQASSAFSVYVLDKNNVFLGSVRRDAALAPLAA